MEYEELWPKTKENADEYWYACVKGHTQWYGYGRTKAAAKLDCCQAIAKHIDELVNILKRAENG